MLPLLISILMKNTFLNFSEELNFLDLCLNRCLVQYGFAISRITEKNNF